jgi:hypothetical protein
LLWSALCNGATVEELTAAAAGRFPATNADQIRQDIGQWVDRLVSDQILTARESGAPETLTVALDEPTEAYAAPTLERYEDMQDLLLLDPIHEVDVTGWPKRPEDSAS